MKRADDDVPDDDDDFKFLSVTTEGRIVTATVANPPMNLITAQVLAELDRFTRLVAEDPDPMVVVLRSDTPGFFICHARYDDIGALKTAEVPASRDDVPLNPMQAMCQRIRGMDKLSIAVVRGRATGGGAALAMACDLRYAGLGEAVFNSFGVPMSTGLGGGASQFMPRLVGTSRSMEVILGGLDLDAATADSWGYVTRALPGSEIDAYVDALARRIAASSRDAVLDTRRLVARALDTPLDEGLRHENFCLQRLAASEDASAGIAAFLKLGGETPEGESRLADLLGEVIESAGRH